LKEVHAKLSSRTSPLLQKTLPYALEKLLQGGKKIAIPYGKSTKIAVKSLKAGSWKERPEMKEKKVTMSIRVGLEERMRIKRCAFDAGETVSEYILKAVRERLKKDEVPMEERSDIDLIQSALNKITKKDVQNEKYESSNEPSFVDILGDYVKKKE
jgi:predicted DNA-binding protein